MAERSGNTQTEAMVKARTHIHYTDRLETLRGISVLQLTTRRIHIHVSPRPSSALLLCSTSVGRVPKMAEMATAKRTRNVDVRGAMQQPTGGPTIELQDWM